MNVVYPNLVREMDRLGITPANMASFLGLSRSAVYRRLQGVSNFKLSEVVKICQYFDNSNAVELFLRFDSNSN